jgi:hypothetical protein
MTRYQFTFARVSTAYRELDRQQGYALFAPPTEHLALVQRVFLNAPTSREAWALFEALYPPKHFTAFSLQTLYSSRTLRGLAAA